MKHISIPSEGSQLDIWGQLVLGKFVFYLRKDKISIGRTSELNIDISVGECACVSRKHLELHINSDKIFFKCFGKNGIFINDKFQPHVSEEVELQKSCTLRFPSTEISLQFDMLCMKEELRDSPFEVPSTSKCYNPKKRALQASYLSQHDSCETRSVSESSSSDGLDQSQTNAPFFMVDSANSHTPPTDYADTSDVNIDLTSTDQSDDATRTTPTVDRAGPSFTPSLEGIDCGSSSTKPPYSYAQLIIQAIVLAPRRRLSLAGIYSFISRHFPYYRPHDKGWQNSIRHNLSLNRYFVRVVRSSEEPGKGSLWRLEESAEPRLARQAFLRRRTKGPGVSRGVSYSRQAYKRMYPAAPDTDNEPALLSIPDRLEDSLITRHPPFVCNRENSRLVEPSLTNSMLTMANLPLIYRPRPMFPQFHYPLRQPQVNPTKLSPISDNGPPISKQIRYECPPEVASLHASLGLPSPLGFHPHLLSPSGYYSDPHQQRHQQQHQLSMSHQSHQNQATAALLQSAVRMWQRHPSQDFVFAGGHPAAGFY